MLDNDYLFELPAYTMSEASFYQKFEGELAHRAEVAYSTSRGHGPATGLGLEVAAADSESAGHRFKSGRRLHKLFNPKSSVFGIASAQKSNIGLVLNRPADYHLLRRSNSG